MTEEVTGVYMLTYTVQIFAMMSSIIFVMLGSLLAVIFCTYVGFMKRHSCNYTSVELTQFDGRARGDDVMGNLTVIKLRASQVTVGTR